MSKMFANPHNLLVFEVQDGAIVSGPTYANHPHRGHFLPARVVKPELNDLDQFHGTADFEVTDDEVLIKFPAVDFAPEERLENHRRYALNSLPKIRKDKETSGIMVDGFTHKVDTSRESQTELTTKVKLALTLPEGDPTTFPVLTDAGYVSVDITTIKAISAALIAHVQACFSEQRAKETSITAATTVEEITTLIS